MRRGTHITAVGSNACPMELPCFSQALSNTVMLQWRRRQSSTRPLLVQTSELAEETQLFRCMLALSIPNACSRVKAQKRLSELSLEKQPFFALFCVEQRHPIDLFCGSSIGVAVRISRARQPHAASGLRMALAVLLAFLCVCRNITVECSKAAEMREE